ncbi:MAG: hypothetical protein ACJASY_003755 [Halioglobus sp.]|jgi:hypothetical protein
MNTAMNLSRTLTTAALAAVLSTPVFAAPNFEGCHQPKSGFATTLCTNTKTCESQTGIFDFILRNADAALEARKLEISGILRGQIGDETNACGLVNAEHLLTDRDMRGSISTGPDVACLSGEGDFVNTLGIGEVIKVVSGDGIYSKVIAGGTVTLRGELGLKSGVNRFVLDVQEGDEVCFSS